MGRFRQRDFSGGLWPSGPADGCPPTALRRARGVWPFRQKSIRSRGGSVVLQQGLVPWVHSFTRFGQNRFYGVGVTFKRDVLFKTAMPSGPIGAPGVVSNVPGVPALNGNRLRFLKMPPSSGLADYLYVARGGNLFKVPPGDASTAVGWGIAPPPDGQATVALTAQATKTIDACDANTGWSSLNNGAGDSVDVDATITVGGGSITNHTGISISSIYQLIKTSFNLNLNEFNANQNDSPDQDWISLAVRVDHPRQIDSIALTFGKDSHFNAGFTFTVTVEDDTGPLKRAKTKGRRRRGLADHPAVSNNESEFLATTPSIPLQIETSALFGDDRISPNDNVWARLKIPKIAFTAVGDATDWTAITALKIVITTNAVGSGTVKVYVDDIKLVGGVGMQGDYQLLFTYASDLATQGYVIRSNPNQIPIVAKNNQRQALTMTFPNGMLSTDPQVHFIEEWRTIGNGSVFFLSQRIVQQAGSFQDAVADYPGLHDTAAAYLQTETLPLDNQQPPGTFIDVAGPHYSRAFWIDGATGHIVYSPPGRPDSVANFIVATGTDNPPQRLAMYNGSMFLLTELDIFEITGTTEPFIPIRVPGGVGTRWPNSVVVTDRGIFYRAVDGIRLFDGFQCRLLGEEALSQLYYGENAENLTPFGNDDGFTTIEGDTVATYTGREYIISDGVQTLAWNAAMQSWTRDFGVGFKMLGYEAETGGILVGTPNGIFGQLDVAGLFTDYGLAIPFEVSPPHFFFRSAEKALVQRCFLEINTNGQPITVQKIVDDVVTQVAIAVNQTTRRQAIEIPIADVGMIFGVIITGQLTQGPVEIFAVEWDGPAVEPEQET